MQLKLKRLLLPLLFSCFSLSGGIDIIPAQLQINYWKSWASYQSLSLQFEQSLSLEQKKNKMALEVALGNVKASFESVVKVCKTNGFDGLDVEKSDKQGTLMCIDKKENTKK